MHLIHMLPNILPIALFPPPSTIPYFSWIMSTYVCVNKEQERECDIEKAEQMQWHAIEANLNWFCTFMDSALMYTPYTYIIMTEWRRGRTQTKQEYYEKRTLRIVYLQCCCIFVLLTVLCAVQKSPPLIYMHRFGCKFVCEIKMCFCIPNRIPTIALPFVWSAT